MEWFSQNWVWVLFFIAMIAMHMFGHGGHGRHGDGGRDEEKPANKGTKQRDSKQGPGHQH